MPPLSPRMRAHTGPAVCADDFGLHAGIDQACARLAQAGRLDAVSCMSAAPAWGRSEHLDALLGAPVSVGLHLDLLEHPVDLDWRQPLPRLIARAYAGAIDTVSLTREIHAQCDRFEAVTSRAPDHVDGHRHTHQLPQVRSVLLGLLQQRYAGQLPWLRSTRSAAPPGTPRFKSRVIEALGARAFAEAAEARGFRLNARFVGVYGFDADTPALRALLQRWLGAASEGDLLMCHPALGMPSPSDADDAIGEARVREWQVLSAADSPLAAREIGSDRANAMNASH